MIAIGRQSPLADQSETDYSGFGPINRGHPKRKIELATFFSPTRIPSFIDWTTSIFSFLGSESSVGVERNRERPVDTYVNHETSGQLGVVKL